MHKPVLFEQTLNAWLTDTKGIYIDGTFGRGGHAKGLLDKLCEEGRLIGIDKDLTAINYGKQVIKDPRLQLVHGGFAEIAAIANKFEIYGKVSGILLDIGVSSPQLDEAQRGFSFLKAGPLDMRMDQTQTLDAQQWVNEAPLDEMIKVFKEYGEERFAGRIAKAIVQHRQEKPITQTLQLAEIVKQANPKWEKNKHPATRVFQAIRIRVNDELETLKSALAQCVDILKPGGRLLVISFHSLEDRIVKQFFKKLTSAPPIPKGLPKGLPIPAALEPIKYKLCIKAIKASDEEIKENPRARSAVLRGLEKLS